MTDIIDNCADDVFPFALKENTNHIQVWNYMRVIQMTKYIFGGGSLLLIISSPLVQLSIANLNVRSSYISDRSETTHSSSQVIELYKSMLY